MTGGSEATTFRTSYPVLGRSFEALMGNAEYSDFDSLFGLDPPTDYDSLIHSYISTMGTNPSDIPSSPWTDSVISDYYSRYSYTSTGGTVTPKTPKRKYKPVDHKV